MTPLLLTPGRGKGRARPPTRYVGTRRTQGRRVPPQAQAEQVGRSLLFSAILISDPTEDKDPEGNAVTQSLIVIADPDSGEWHGGSKYLLEVPDDVAEQYGRELRAGDSIVVVGRLNKGSCFTATEIQPRTPPGEETGQ